MTAFVSKNNIETGLAALLLYLTMGPYFAWNILRSEVVVLGMYAVVAFLFFKNNNSRSMLSLFLYLIFIILIHWIAGRQSIFGFLSTCMCLFLPFYKTEFGDTVFNQLLNVYCIILLGSLVVWPFALSGLIPSFGTIEPINELKNYGYTVFPLVIIPNDLTFFRFCGPFDEPGVVGTFNAIFIVCLKFNFNNWRTLVLLASGVVSLSLFFLLVALFYFFISIVVVKHELYKLFFFVVIIFSSYYITKDNDIISFAVWERLEWNKDENTIAGDNRMHEEGQEIYLKKQWSKDYWLGDDSFDKYKDAFEGSSSYKVVVLRCGMIFFILYISFFLFYAKKFCDFSHFLIFATVFLSAMYQRPNMFGLHFFFLFPYLAQSLGKTKLIDK